MGTPHCTWLPAIITGEHSCGRISHVPTQAGAVILIPNQHTRYTQCVLHKSVPSRLQGQGWKLAEAGRLAKCR